MTYWTRGPSHTSLAQMWVRQGRYGRHPERRVWRYLHATAVDAVAQIERNAADVFAGHPDADARIARARAGEYLEVRIVGEDTDGTPLVEPTGRYHHVRYRAPRGI